MDGEKLSTTNYWGIIGEVGQGWFRIHKQHYAPGLWAGINNCRFNINNCSGENITVFYVELETGKIYYHHDWRVISPINIGDVIYLGECQYGD